jgi:hypothetical protein
MTQRRKTSSIPPTHPLPEPVETESEQAEVEMEVEVKEEEVVVEPIVEPKLEPKPLYVRPTPPLSPKEVSRHPRNIPRYSR